MKSLTRWLQVFISDEIEVDDPVSPDQPTDVPDGAIPIQAQPTTESVPVPPSPSGMRIG